jgi:hypothetical protein
MMPDNKMVSVTSTTTESEGEGRKLRTLKRSEPHAGIDRFPILDAAKRSSRSEMADDGVNLGLRLLELFSEGPKDRGVGESVESKLQLQTRVRLAQSSEQDEGDGQLWTAHLPKRHGSWLVTGWDGVRVNLFGEGSVEEGVE